MAYDFMGKPEMISTARNTLSVDGVLYQRLLAKLDESGESGSPSAKRVFRRLEYAHAKLCIHIESDGHNSRALVVATRNLSQGGISILHSNFMYNGTVLTVDLIDNTGKIVSRRGTVTRCEHRGGRIHEIGVKFDREITLREFLTPNPINLLHSRERVDPQSMNIKVLIYSDETEFNSLIRQHLNESSLRYTFAKTEDEAMEKLADQEMVICHLDPGTIGSAMLVHTMREQGFTSPIILIGHPSNPIDMHIVSACGADMILPWPCDEGTLLCSIGEFILNDWTPESLENIRSCLSPEARQTLTMELARLGVTLNQQIRTNNQDKAYNTCLQIKMLAPMLGLNSMRDHINMLTSADNKADSIKNHAEDLAQIALICKGIGNQSNAA